MQRYTDDRPDGAIITCYCTDPHLLCFQCVLFAEEGKYFEVNSANPFASQKLPIVSADAGSFKSKTRVKFFGILAGAPELVKRNKRFEAYVSVQISGISDVTVKNDMLADALPGDLVQLQKDENSDYVFENFGPKPQEFTSYAGQRIPPVILPTLEICKNSGSARGSDVIGKLLSHGRYPLHKAKFLLLPGLDKLKIEDFSDSEENNTESNPTQATTNSLSTPGIEATNSQSNDIESYTLQQIYTTYAPHCDERSTKIKSIISTLQALIKETLEDDLIRQAFEIAKT